MNRFTRIVLLGMILTVPFLMVACDDDDDTPASVGPGPPAASTGVWVVADNAALPADNVANFLGDNTYFNVHSAAFPEGEIRGQIDFTPTTVKFAALDGAQEVPANASTAKGGGILAFNDADNTIAGFVVTEGVTGTAAHIHAGARGVPGGIVVPLEGGPSHWFVPDNTTLPADNVANFLGDNTYFNVHSAAFPEGEIRGQVDLTPTNTAFASLDGAQEVPPNGSTARGAGIAAFDAADNTIAGFVVTTGVTGTAAHIHARARGVPGGIVVPLEGGASHWFIPDNTTLPSDNVANFLADNAYYNVHSAAFPEGEIRGQLDRTPTSLTTTGKFASLDGAQEVPPNGSTALGGGVLVFESFDNTIAGFVVTKGVTGTVAHIHAGARATAGGIIEPLLPSP